jgi:hypothetical protein
MPLHYTRDGYTLRADADGLTIDPGPKPITLGRQELAQLDLQHPATISRFRSELMAGRMMSLVESSLPYRRPSVVAAAPRRPGWRRTSSGR